MGDDDREDMKAVKTERIEVVDDDDNEVVIMDNNDVDELEFYEMELHHGEIIELHDCIVRTQVLHMHDEVVVLEPLLVRVLDECE